MAKDPPGPAQRAFTKALKTALAQVPEGERGAERLSGVGQHKGVGHATWSDTKLGKTFPSAATWARMRTVLFSDAVEMPGVDWDALFKAAKEELGKGRTPARPKRPALSDRHFLAGLDTIKSFALPVVNRLDLLPDDIRRADAEAGRITFVTGEGGMGKSILLRQLAQHLAQPQEDGGAAVVTVLCNRVEAMEDLMRTDRADVALARAAELPHPESGLVKALQRLSERHGSVHLLIDTLDVVTTERTAHALASLLKQCSLHAQVFVTCRKQEYDDLYRPDPSAPWHGDSRLHAIRMPDLSDVEILRWAEDYVDSLQRSELQKRRFLTSLSDPSRARTVKRICAVPLRLAMACDLFSEGGWLPGDLTITGLYETYWKHRIARDRHLRVTSQSAAQEVDAFDLADRILTIDGKKLTLWVAYEDDEPGIGLKALVSEGVVLERSGRYGFFHQTFAEFAIALILTRRDRHAHLDRLRSQLEDTGSHMWPVALHLLLLEEITQSRYEELAAVVPLDVPIGAQFQLLSALSRGLPDRLKAVADHVAAQSEPLLVSLVGYLADAPAECARTALDISMPLLKTCDEQAITEVARTIGLLLPKLPSPIPYLSLSLQHVERRRADLSNDIWINLPSFLIEQLCEHAFGDSLHQLLCARYQQLGSIGKRLLLSAVITDPEAVTNPIALLAEPMLSESPPGIDIDDQVELLHWCWADDDIRERLGWHDWIGLLEADLPPGWDSVQVRLVRRLCEDAEIRDALLAGVLSERASEYPERWTNTAKFVADDFRHETGLAVGRHLHAPGRRTIGNALALTSQIAEDMQKEERQTLIEAFQAHAAGDPRRVWTALVEVAGPELDLHEALLTDFEKVDQRRTRAASDDEPDQEWTSIRVSPIGAWLRIAPTEFLMRQRERFRSLIPAERGEDTARRARLEGRIAVQDDTAKAWITAQILEGASASAALRGLESFIDESVKAGSYSRVDDAVWRCGALRTPHATVAIQLARLLADPAATPDAVLMSPVPGDESASPDEATVVELLSEVVPNRIRAAFDTGESTLLVKELLSLLFRVDEHRPLSGTLVRELVEKTSAPLLRSGATAGRSAAVQDGLSEQFTRWSTTMRKLGATRLPTAEVRQNAEAVLAGWDCGRIGTANRRKTASLIRSVLDCSPDFMSWLEEAMWPNASVETKFAIAEAVVVHESNVLGHGALSLSQRLDCPPEVRVWISKKLEP